jgi:hypothetical protein
LFVVKTITGKKFPAVKFHFPGYGFQLAYYQVKKIKGLFHGVDCAISIIAGKILAGNLSLRIAIMGINGNPRG